MKKGIVWLLTLLMLLALAGCGQSAATAPAKDAAPPAEQSGGAAAQSAPAQESAQGGQSIAPADSPAGSRLAAFAANYLADGDYVMEYLIDGAEATAAYKGDFMYIHSTMEGMESIIIRNDDGLFVLMPGEKMAIRMDAAPEELEDIAAEMEADGSFTTGDTEVNGKSYYYEEYAEEGGVARYCFDGDMLRYIIATADGESTTMEIVSVKKGADDALFTMPSGYTIMG